MKFTIFTHVPHIKQNNKYFAYGPYVKEINIWGKNVSELVLVAPLSEGSRKMIDDCYSNSNIKFLPILNFNILSLKSRVNTLLKLPGNLFSIFKAMKESDHIHLRCPGNIGLLGCFVQIFFPNTPKTAKYAGNWDPKSKQPWSYRLQKWILSNTFLTRKMQVLVYGEWPNQSENIKPFFTASYSEKEKQPLQSLDLNGTINFIFVGSLVVGKNPLYAIQLVEYLLKNNHKVKLNVYGDGVLKAELERYTEDNHLEKHVFLHGNQSATTIKKAYQGSHFVILASKSEGWPKAIAEGMFWGCVPMVTAVSCVPFMLDYGKRGLLLEMNLEKDLKQIELLLQNQSLFNSKSRAAWTWSRKYTVDFFEQEIRKLLLQD